MKLGRKVTGERKGKPATLSAGLAAVLTLALVSYASAENIDTASGWNGVQDIGTWGAGYAATVGQTITPDASQTLLESFTFNVRNTSGVPSQYQGFVYQWDTVNHRITGSALYASAVMTAPASASFVPVTITTGGTALAANQQYALFLTTSTVSGQASGGYRLGYFNTDVYSAGQLVFDNNANFSELFSSWDNWVFGDWAFLAMFGLAAPPPPPPPPVLTSVINQGNTVALGAAGVLDAHANLVWLFAGLETEAEISNAVSQTLPLLIGGTAAATRDTLNSVNRIVQTRIESKRGMASGDDFFGDSNVWLKPFGSWGDQDARGGVAGYTTETYGMVGGVDGHVSSVVQLGGALAVAKVDIDGESSLASQSADVDIFEFIGYGSYSLNDRTNINFQAGFGHNSNEGRRQIDFIAAMASSDYDGQSAHLSFGVDRTYALGQQTTFVPTVSATYIRVDEEAYTETGADLLNLTVDGRTAEALILGTDAKLIYTLTDQASLFGDLGVGYDTINDQASISAAFAGAPNVFFITNGIDPSPWLVQGGVGALYKVKNNLEITGRYDAEYRSDYLNQTASVKLSWLF